eukprot:671043-Pelagomonas_calceolata.AAC.1
MPLSWYIQISRRDVPCTRLGSEAPPDVSQAWLQSLPTTQHNQSSTAYVSLCCVRSQYEVGMLCAV